MNTAQKVQYLRFEEVKEGIQVDAHGFTAQNIVDELNRLYGARKTGNNPQGNNYSYRYAFGKIGEKVSRFFITARPLNEQSVELISVNTYGDKIEHHILNLEGMIMGVRRIKTTHPDPFADCVFFQYPNTYEVRRIFSERRKAMKGMFICPVGNSDEQATTWSRHYNEEVTELINSYLKSKSPAF